MRTPIARRMPPLAAVLVGACMTLAATVTAAQGNAAVFGFVDNTNLAPNPYQIYVMGVATVPPLVLQQNGTWTPPATGSGTMTVPCWRFPQDIKQLEINAAQAGLSARAYYFIVTDFTKFPSCNPSPGQAGLFNNPFGFSYTYPSGGAFTLTTPPVTTVIGQTLPAWTFSEIGASSTGATNDLSQVDFFAFPMNMQSSVAPATPPNPSQVGNPVGPGNPAEAVNHASIRDAYLQWASALAQSAGAACSNPTPPPACEWQKLVLDIPPTPPATMPQYVLQNPATYLIGTPASSLNTMFDGLIGTLWATSGAPTLTLDTGGAFGAIPQDTFTSSIVTIDYPSVPANTYAIKAMKFVGQSSGYIAYVFDPMGMQAGCAAAQIATTYCANPRTTGYQVFAGAGAMAGPVNLDNWTTLNATPGALKPGTASADYNGLASRLAFLVSGAMNRGVALVQCTGQQTWQCWQNETYWYPTTVSATFPDITQNLFSYWLHTASIQGTPVMVQPPGALSSASSVAGGSSKKMGMAYGFSNDENPTPQWVPPQPEVPSKFDNTIPFPSTGSITFGPWVPSALNPTLLVSRVPSNGGSVTSSPAGINCDPTCSHAYTANASVSLTATSAPGFVFSNWSGACSGTSTTCSVTVNGTTSVTANFTQIAPTSFPLNVVVTGPGGVSSGPPGVNCPAVSCSVAFAANASVTLTAAPLPGATFASWSGACAGSGLTCTVTMSAARNVGAAFTSGAQQTLTVQGSVGGTVTTAPTGINCGTTCVAGFASGTSVSVVATPSAGYQFTGWSGACTGTSVCDLVMDSNKSVTAAFSIVPPGQFSLTVADFGNGSIVSAPAGIACGATCATTYPAGTLVVLTAVPGAGHSFAGWGGACGGLGACTVVMDQGQSVNATFVPSAAPTTAVQVPTLSQWALFLLCALMGLVALAQTRSMRRSRS